MPYFYYGKEKADQEADEEEKEKEDQEKEEKVVYFSFLNLL